MILRDRFSAFNISVQTAIYALVAFAAIAGGLSVELIGKWPTLRSHPLAATGLIVLLSVSLVVCSWALERLRRQPSHLSERLDGVKNEYEAIFSRALDATLVLDDSGKCLRANPAAAELLAKYRKDRNYPPVEGGWMFYGSKEKKPIDMDNLSRREIPQFINGAWRGWHAFRRGLGTRLNEMGVDDKEIQSILRHADISTTQAYYILPNIERAKAGLKKLGAVAQKKYGIKV